MYGDDEAVIGIALEEGVLSRQEADFVREEARRLGRSPLELLRERGRLSEDVVASFQRRASDRRERHAASARAAPREQADDGQARLLEHVSPLDETASVAPGGASPPPVTPPVGEGSAFPVSGWDRYQYVGFLGQGGMGRVFLAYDPRLRRKVALKFVRDDHPELAHRFLSEARAQAKVNHERVCKVYEVGQVGGNAFIAMQYVEGRPLGALVRELTVEQKALVLRETALGVHEAHRVGLIHRDIKPSNIMVERGEDGVPRPYVMDFGLARDWKEGVTVTGTVLGTPHYMAPEQARGEVARLDRRADVYSLGATLYALLTGQPPIQGANGLEVLNNLATVEPRPPRALDRNIPPDLEAITLKCLEKEPSARYDSARALAEDLDRFLAGEPVLARTGPGYRLRKRLRKHRLLVSVASAALLALVVAVGWGVLTRREASERERLNRHFTELADRLESRVRYSALSRLHDAREDRQAIQATHAQLEALEAEMREGGEQALGPGHYALGRGSLALGDPEKAREHLEVAWQHGFREPGVAYALALALGQSYQQKFLEAEKIRGDDERRDAMLRDIERRYRDPALVYLQRSRGAEVPSPEYVAALTAFYEGRLDDALARLDAVSGNLRWFYEAPKLRGDILVARFYRRWHEDNLEGAKADLEAGRKAYATAATIAESAPAVYQGLSQLESAEMALQEASGGDTMSAYSRSRDALNQCLRVAPDDYACWVALARLHHLRFSTRLGRIGVDDVEKFSAQAIEAAERALALDPARPEARTILAVTSMILARQRMIRNEDPSEQLQKAVDWLDSIRPEDRDLSFYNLSALVFMNRAEHAALIGEDSLGYLDRGIQECRAAIAIDDRVSNVWMNLGHLYSRRADDRRNSEPERDLAQALLAYEKSLRLSPKMAMHHQDLADVYRKQAWWLRNRGGNPTPDRMSALEQYRQMITLSYKPAWGYYEVGSVLLDQARDAWEQGEDPFPLLEQSRASIEQAISLVPETGYAQLCLGALLAQRARYLHARGEDPGPSVREAEALMKRGLERLPGDEDLSFVLGSVHVIRAGFDVDHGRAPGPDLSHAEAELRQALVKMPKDSDTRFSKVEQANSAKVWLQLGEARTIGARWRARDGKARAEDFEEATKSYEKAIELDPDELEYPLRLGQHCSTWAHWLKTSGGEYGPVLKRGLELVDRILKVRPDWKQAQELRASLLQLSP